MTKIAPLLIVLLGAVLKLPTVMKEAHLLGGLDPRNIAMEERKDGKRQGQSGAKEGSRDKPCVLLLTHCPPHSLGFSPALRTPQSKETHKEKITR